MRDLAPFRRSNERHVERHEIDQHDGCASGHCTCGWVCRNNCTREFDLLDDEVVVGGDMNEQVLDEMDRARRDFEHDRFERALVRYDKILVTTPDSVSARIGRARSLTCLRKAAAASEALATIDLTMVAEF